MSIWHKANSEDIEVNHEDEEVEILVFGDHNGNHYVTVTFEQMRNLYDKM